MALVTVTAMLIGFALPALLHLKNTPPARVLRRTVTAPPLRFGLAYVLAVGALFAILWSLVRDTELVVGVLAGVLGVGVALALAGYGLVRLTGRLRGGVGVAWRYGLANVSRRGAGSVVQIVAFGLGLMMLLLLAVVRGDLLADWRRSLPSDVPNNFMVNIRPEERAPLEDFLKSHGFGEPQMYPMVRARMTAIDGVPSRVAASSKGDRARGFVEREQNLTWSAALMDDNQLVAGRWWTPAEFGKPLVSISPEYQEALGLKLGDTLELRRGRREPLTVRVASIRKVRWDSFRPNFFLVFPPGSAGRRRRHLHDQRVPDRRAAARRWSIWCAGFPTVSVFDVDAILKQIREIMDRASLAVQYVFLFTLAAGVVVLLAAVQSTRDERRYESAMLRTLGASRSTVLQRRRRGILGAGISVRYARRRSARAPSAGSWRAACSRSSSRFDPWVWVLGLVCGTVLVGVSGTLATRRVVNTPPIVTLRDEASMRRMPPGAAGAVSCTSRISQPSGIGIAAGGSASIRTV